MLRLWWFMLIHTFKTHARSFSLLKEWSRQLSPFYLGPVELFDGNEAKNMENAWQFAKVYSDDVSPETGDPAPGWWNWAKAGWKNPDPVRFPMGTRE